MTDMTADVYRERGRVWVRMEMSEAEYTALEAALAPFDGDEWSMASDFFATLRAGERTKQQALDWARYEDAPPLD